MAGLEEGAGFRLLAGMMGKVGFFLGSAAFSGKIEEGLGFKDLPKLVETLLGFLLSGVTKFPLKVEGLG